MTKKQKNYTYTGSTPYVLSNKDKTLIINKGDNWKVFKTNKKQYQVLLLKKSELPVLVTLDDSSFNSLISISKAVSGTFKYPVFSVNNENIEEIEIEQLYNETIKDVNKQLNIFLEQIKNISVAANYTKISSVLSDYLENMKSVLESKDENNVELNLHGNRLKNPSTEIQEKREQLKKIPTLDLDAWDHGLKKLSFKHISSIENTAKIAIKNALEWSKEGGGEFSMITMFISDSLDYMETASYLQKGEIEKAVLKADDLDTAARDNFDQTFWKNTVLALSSDNKKLKKHENKCKILIKEKEKADIEKGLKFVKPAAKVKL